MYTDPTGHDVGFHGMDPTSKKAYHADLNGDGKINPKGETWSDENLQKRWADLHKYDGRGWSREQLINEANAYQTLGPTGVMAIAYLADHRWQLAGLSLAGIVATGGAVVLSPEIPAAAGAIAPLGKFTGGVSGASLLVSAGAWYIGQDSSLSLAAEVVLNVVLDPAETIDDFFKGHVDMLINAYNWAEGLGKKH